MLNHPAAKTLENSGRTGRQEGGASAAGAKSMRKPSMSGYTHNPHPPPKGSKFLTKSSGHPGDDRLSIASADRRPPPGVCSLQNAQQTAAPKATAGGHHQRNRSDVHQLKQDQKPLLISQTLDNGQGQGGITGPVVAHSTKNVSQTSAKNAFLQHQILQELQCVL